MSKKKLSLDEFKKQMENSGELELKNEGKGAGESLWGRYWDYVWGRVTEPEPTPNPGIVSGVYR